MTIYRLYQQNGHRAGFWVQHRTWRNTCGRVVSIAGRDMGPLPGAPPRHDEAAIVIELFDVRSGRMLEHATLRGAHLPGWAEETKEAADGAASDAAGEEKSVAEAVTLDVADRQYASIAEPSWHGNSRQHAGGGSNGREKR